MNHPMKDPDDIAFETWWHNEGSGMPPKGGEDIEEHVKRVSHTAWVNGAYKAREAAGILDLEK